MNRESHVTPDGNRKPTSQRSAGEISAVFCDSSTDPVLTLCGPGRASCCVPQAEPLVDPHDRSLTAATRARLGAIRDRGARRRR